MERTDKMQTWVKPYIKQNKKRIALAVLLGVIGAGSGAMLLFVSGYLISKSSLRPENIMVVYVPVVSVRAFSIGQAVFLYLEKLVSHDIALRILAHMRTKLYRIIEPQAAFLRTRFRTGDLLNVLADDIEHLQDLYLRTIFPSILGLTLYVIVALVFGFFDIIFGIFVILTLAIIVFLIPLVSYIRSKKHHFQIKKQRQSLYEQLTDALFGLTDWLASGKQTTWMKNFFKTEDKLLQAEQSFQKMQIRRDLLSQFFVGVIIVLTIIWTSIQTTSEVITPTLIAAFVLMMFSIADALLPLSEAIEKIPSYSDSLKRMNQVEDRQLSDETFEQQFEDNIEVRLEMKNLSYTYPSSKEKVLSNIDLTIEQGKKIALLGRSGAGKSTLLKLIAGIIKPTEGTVEVNGEAVSEAMIAKQMAILNQKPHLFSTTIRNNIRIGKQSATDEEISEVVRKAQLTPLIEQLPNGLDTQMEEMGSRFSGGERQRIAFARILLQDTPIIIIDEATVGLDPLTEQSLTKTVLESTKDKTVIWITHHLTGVNLMDEVVFLRDGKIALQGSHEQLIRSSDYYKKLYEMDQGTYVEK